MQNYEQFLWFISVATGNYHLNRRSVITSDPHMNHSKIVMLEIAFKLGKYLFLVYTPKLNILPPFKHNNVTVDSYLTLSSHVSVEIKCVEMKLRWDEVQVLRKQQEFCDRYSSRNTICIPHGAMLLLYPALAIHCSKRGTTRMTTGSRYVLWVLD